MSKNLQNILKDKYEEYKSNLQKNNQENDAKLKGMFFENFCCDEFLKFYDIDTEDFDIEDCIYRTNDNNLDIIISSHDTKNDWVVIQAFASGEFGSKTPSLDSKSREKYERFFDKCTFDKIGNTDWIKENFKQKEHQNKILDLKKAIENGESVRWIFATKTKKISVMMKN